MPMMLAAVATSMMLATSPWLAAAQSVTLPYDHIHINVPDPTATVALATTIDELRAKGVSIATDAAAA